MSMFRTIGKVLISPFYSLGSDRVISISRKIKVSVVNNPDWKILPSEQQRYKNLKLRISMSPDEINNISTKYGGVVKTRFSSYVPCGIAPMELLGAPTGSARFISIGFKAREKVLEKFINNGRASFKKNFSGGELLIIGSGRGASEVIELIKLFPNLRAIHIINVLEKQFETLDNELQEYKNYGGAINPELYVYKMNALELPKDLTQAIDMVYHANVFDPEYFSPSQRQQAANEIARVLKYGGIDVMPVLTLLGSLFFPSSTFDNHEDGFEKYLDGAGLTPLKRGNFQIRYK